MKKEKTKTEKIKKESSFYAAAYAERPKSNAINDGLCAADMCLWRNFLVGSDGWLLCEAAELRGTFFMIVPNK